MKIPKFSEILSAHNKSLIGSKPSLGPQPADSVAEQENQKPDSDPENTFGTPESCPPVELPKPKVTPASKKSSYHLSISDEKDRQYISNLESKVEDLEIQMKLERQAYDEFKKKTTRDNVNDQSVISDVSNKVNKLTDALSVKDQQIQQMQEMMRTMQLSMKHMKLDLE